MALAHLENNMDKCSVLRDFVENLDYNDTLDNLKTRSIEHINSNNVYVRDKHKMCVHISQSKTRDSLIRYLFNALLKYEGHGVI